MNKAYESLNPALGLELFVETEFECIFVFFWMLLVSINYFAINI